ncbi:MAG: DUF4981 domain-containing protein [Clostridiales bacterium]|nr:DUF4981 domain-containing protein [Clostridiales bacterium]
MNFTPFHKSLEQLHVGCEAPRAYFIPFSDERSALLPRESSEFFTDLCGEWDFHFFNSFELLEPDVTGAVNAQSEFDVIAVPRCWQTYTDRGYDKPLYSNLRYPFPVDPPHVPNENPCGLYSRKFTLLPQDAQREIYINFEGVSSCFYLFVNGAFAAYSQVSHCTSEINITPYIHEGENDLRVLVVKWCDGSYLEDQDFFRLSGIFRGVYLLSRDKTHIRDMFIKPEVEADLSLAHINVSLDITGSAAVHCTLCSPDGEKIHEGDYSVSDFTIDAPAPVLWNDEQPRLYSMYISLGNEVILEHIAVRRLVIENSVLLLNGKGVKTRGVNRHDSHPDFGYYTPYEHFYNDLMLLKRANCNAIRTSHYPNDPRFTQLCDELGFMVIDEADIETHGMGYNNDDDWDWFRWSSLSDSPDWRAAYVDRAARLFERDKNRGCVIMWSLGNESGAGRNHRAMAQYIRSRDSRALIHYENSHLEFKAVAEGENFSDISDVESRMYANIEYAEGYLTNPAYTKPFWLCEYVCSMTTGDVYANWDLVEKYDNFAGGCIWELTDHAVNVPDENGKPRYCYGGDFGDFPNDGICCVDGLVFPDRTPRPGYYDMKRVYQQYSARLIDGKAVEITSRRRFTSLSDLALEWSVECDSKTVKSGKINALDIQPLACESYELLTDADYAELSGNCFLTLRFVQNTDTVWAKSGFETGFEQFELECAKTSESAECGVISSTDDGRYLNITCGNDAVFSFDKLRGVISGASKAGKKIITEPVIMNMWRAPTYNGAPAQWKKDRLDHAVQSCRSMNILHSDDGHIVIETEQTLSAPSSPPTVRAKISYVFSSGGVEIVVDASVRENLPMLPRLGLNVVLAAGFENIEYFGLGEIEAYPDRCRSAKYGLYKTTVNDMFVHYVRPQENGEHIGTRYAKASNCETGAQISFTPSGIKEFAFKASHFTDKMIADTAHDFELAPLAETIINLDFRVNAIGLDSLIAKKEPGRILDQKKIKFGFKLSIK